MGNSVVAQLAEKLGPDGIYRLLKPHISGLPAPTGGRTQVLARCPRSELHKHADRHPSWSWNLAEGVSNCFACGYSRGFVKFLAEQRKRTSWEVITELAERYGVPLSRRPALTLAEYAKAKCLPSEFLQEEFRLAEDPERGLLLPYLDSAGQPIVQRQGPVTRYRRSMTQKPLWPRGTKAKQLVYGLHGLPWIGRCGYVLAVEGESDLHTAWFHDLPALAMPGCGLGEAALARAVRDSYAHTVYAVLDSDDAGYVMLERLDTALRKEAWLCKNGRAKLPKRLLAVRLPVKDLSAMHCEVPKRFMDVLDAALIDAQPAKEALLAFKRQTKQDEDAVLQTMRLIRHRRDVGALDKLILAELADLTGAVPGRAAPVTKAELARKVGVPRRTLFDHLPVLVEKGLLPAAGGLSLTEAAVRDSH